MRVYLPSTVPRLQAALAAGEVGPAPLWAFAVTPALREWYVEGDAEELEYAAMNEAARASLRLLDIDPGAVRRRVVLAADVPDASVTVRGDVDRATVSVGGAVPLSRVASAHVDEAEAEAAVAKAVDAVIEAELGSDDAQFAVDGAEGYELLWYATQELPGLVAALTTGWHGNGHTS